MCKGDRFWHCECHDDFYGFDCSLSRCPTGDDPFTPGDNEVQQITCEATQGSALLEFRNARRLVAWDATRDDLLAALVELFSKHKGDERIIDDDVLPEPMNAQLNGAIGVEVFGETWCDEPGVKTRVRFLQDFGDPPLLQADTSKLGGKISIVEVFKGTKEDDACSNRGVCNTANGQCECDQENWASSDGYGNAGSRGDCGMAVNTIVDCPGEVACSGHGACDSATFRCACQQGWTGADCSLMTCPHGRSWISLDRAECSDMGLCDETSGRCSCARGFTGAACEYFACPADVAGRECSGHGECLTLAQLALTAETDDGLNAGLTYDDWDHDMIRGCKCDDGYSSYDCSERTCAFGDDPLTPHIVEHAECSNRGLCETLTGKCDCSPGFGASDGHGHRGLTDDCGYALPLNPVVFEDRIAPNTFNAIVQSAQ